MDLDEWEFLPDSKSFLDLGHHVSAEEHFKEFNFVDKVILEMDYFICPSQSQSPCPPIKPQLGSEHKSGEVLPDKLFKDISFVPEESPPPAIPANRDAVAQVFFKKMKESEFVDMRARSPRSNSTRGTILPHVESDPIPLEEEEEKEKEKEQKPLKEIGLEEEEEGIEEEKKKNMENDLMDPETEKKPCSEGINVSILGWKLTGIGALFSIGVAAAASISILVLGGHQQKQQQQQQQQQQNIQFQIYTQDKRFKQAVQQATGALSAVRGAPMTTARISFGGYYEWL